MPIGISIQPALSLMPEGPSVVVTAGIPFSLSDGKTPAYAPAFPLAPSGLFIE